MSRLGVAILLLLLAAAAVFFVVVPQWRNTSSIRAEIARLQSLSEELNGLAADRDALTQQYNAIPEADLAKIRLLTPRGPSTSQALVEFESLAKKDNLLLKQVDFSGTDNGSGASLGLPSELLYHSIPLTLSLSGAYENFRLFLSGLERDIRLTDVEGIDFGSGQGTTILSITLKGKVYSRD